MPETDFDTQVREAQRFLVEGRYDELLAYLLDRPVEDVRRVSTFVPSEMDLNRPIAPIADHQLEIVLLGPAAVPEGATVRSRPELAKLDVPVDADRGWNIFVSATGGVLAPHFVSRILSPEEAARQIDEFTRPR